MATVKRLIEILRNFDDDTVVVLASDPEGNEFREADDLVGIGFWDGEEYANEDESDNVNAVAIWPVG